MCKKIHILAFFPAVLMMAAIFWFSAAPAEQSSELSNGITYKMVDQIGSLPFVQWDEAEKLKIEGILHGPIRKAAHFSEYALLAVLWVAPLGFFSGIKGKKRLIITFFICVLYAVFDELHQLFVPGRDGNIRDVLIDTSGAVMGLLLWYACFGRGLRGCER